MAAHATAGLIGNAAGLAGEGVVRIARVHEAGVAAEAVVVLLREDIGGPDAVDGALETPILLARKSADRGSCLGTHWLVGIRFLSLLAVERRWRREKRWTLGAS